MKIIYHLLLLLFLVSCKQSEKDKMLEMMNAWSGKEVSFVAGVPFSVLGKDTLEYAIPSSAYKIITYADSTGCIGCKLQLKNWQYFIKELDSMEGIQIPVLFFLHPKDAKELIMVLKENNFSYPVCIDKKDAFNKLNHFPADERFQTFLLDKDNKVIAIGNPIHNPKVKELYMKIILGDKSPKEQVERQTTVVSNNTIINLGKFDWRQEQKAIFTLTNTGNRPLVITDIVTTCGCTTVDYEKEPVRSGNNIGLRVHYKADHPEHFDKTITVYCNAATSPLKLRITGNAE